MSKNGKTHVHFMGIAGSGCASIAELALAAGYQVTGCDQDVQSLYAKDLIKKGVKIYQGHNEDHLTEDVDIVAVSPAIFSSNPNEPELLKAREKNILMTWQEFMGKYLQEDKRVIAISGTHGKTTTTFLTGEVLINGGLAPTIEGGSVFQKYGSGGKSGTSDLFLCEADEYNRNFYHYFPRIAVINNMEMDHPECYRDFAEVKDAFKTFLLQNNLLEHLILSGNSEGCLDVLKETKEELLKRGVKIYVTFKKGTLIEEAVLKDTIPVSFEIFSQKNHCTKFAIYENGNRHDFVLKLNGAFNVSNATHAFLIAEILGVSDEKIGEVFESFEGVYRRFQQIGTYRNVPIFDDYAHHPTELNSLLTMCREYFPEDKIFAYFEPHQMSRLSLMFDEYVNALKIADHVLIGKTHIGRESLTKQKPISEERWLKASEKFMYDEDAEHAKKIIRDFVDNGKATMVLVIGAASSYKISRMVADHLEVEG